MEVDADLAIRLVIENANSLPARTVLTQMTKYPKLQVPIVVVASLGAFFCSKCCSPSLNFLRNISPAFESSI